jgi:hypothetical protein
MKSEGATETLKFGLTAMVTVAPAVTVVGLEMAAKRKLPGVEG